MLNQILLIFALFTTLTTQMLRPALGNAKKKIVRVITGDIVLSQCFDCLFFTKSNSFGIRL